MPQQDPSQERKSRDQKTVRGESLRSKMIESEEEGERYREENQGADLRVPDVDHEKERARTRDQDEPLKNSRRENR